MRQSHRLLPFVRVHRMGQLRRLRPFVRVHRMHRVRPTHQVCQRLQVCQKHQEHPMALESQQALSHRCHLFRPLVRGHTA